MTTKSKEVDMVLEDETLRSEGIQQATEEEQRGLPKQGGNDVSEPNLKRSSEMDEISAKKHSLSYITTKKIGTWIVRSMKLRKLEIVKRGMTRTGLRRLGVGEFRWKDKGQFLLDEHKVFYAGHEKKARKREPP